MVTKLFVVEVVVNDFDAACQWYQEKLKLLPDDTISNQDGQWCTLKNLSGENVNLALWQPAVGMPLPVRQDVPSLIPIFVVDNLRAFIENLQRDGVKVTGIKDREEYIIATIEDLDGNRLQLYESAV